MCAFLTNEILREKTSASTGVLNDISTTAKSLDTYLKGIENVCNTTPFSAFFILYCIV